MRFAYDNIVDDLNASTLTALTTATGYSVLDVQDQRLSTRWVSSAATTQSILCELPTFPEYPDSSSATLYFQAAWATTDSWADTRGVLAVTAGTLIDTIASGETLLSLQRTLGNATGKSVYIRCKSSTPAFMPLTVAGTPTNGSYVNLTGNPATQWNVYSALLLASAPAAISVYCETGVAGDSMTIDWIYCGTGAYTTTLEDFSGNGNDATVYGAVPVDANVGRALSFDGTNDYAYSAATQQIVADFSFSVWVKPTDTAAVDRGIFGNLDYAPTPYGCSMSQYGTQFKIYWESGAGYTWNDILVAGEWRHIVLVYASGTFYLYVNGLLNANTKTQAFNQGSTKFTIGRWDQDYSNYYFSGCLKDCRVYSRSLGAAEITHIYSRERWIGESSGLVGWWDVDHGLGVNMAAILGHNILSGTPVKIQGNNTDNWTDPDVDETLTVNDGAILRFFDSTYYQRFWRFYFTTQASVEAGRIWLGEYLTVDPSSTLDFSVIKRRSDTVIHSRGRQKFASIGTGWRRFELSFPKTEEEMIYLLSLMYDAVGNHSSLIFCNFDTIRDYVLVEPCYVSIDGELGFAHADRMGFTYSLSLEEEL